MKYGYFDMWLNLQSLFKILDSLRVDFHSNVIGWYPKSWLNIEVVKMKKPFNNRSNKIRKVHLQVTLDKIENVSVYNWDSIYVIKWKKMWIKSNDKFRRKCCTFFKIERGVPSVPVYQPSCVTFKLTERDWLKESKS